MRHAETEAQFMRFINAIEMVIDAYPEAIKINPQTISVETYAARFRDAVKAKVKHGYKIEKILEPRFTEHYKEITTHMDNGFVLLGTRDGIKRYLAKSVGEVLTADNKPELTLKGEDPTCLGEVCRLLANRVFDPAPTIIVHIPDHSKVVAAESVFDVSFLPIPNRPDHYRLT